MGRRKKEAIPDMPEEMKEMPAVDFDETEYNPNPKLEEPPVPPEPDEPSPKDYREGHRGRLRKRYLEAGGFESFSDVEILEFILTYSSPRRDTKGTAHELLDTFGSLKAVLEARPEQLLKVNGVGEVQAAMLMMAVELTRVYDKQAGLSIRRIMNRLELETYCKGLLVGQRSEQFYVICVDAQCRLLGRRKVSEGSLSEVSAYPRSVMEAALNFNAHSVFFCHNHPGGTCSPSPEDIASTVSLQRLLHGVGIQVLDHIIIAGTAAYSMAQHGDVDFRNRGNNR